LNLEVADSRLIRCRPDFAVWNVAALLRKLGAVMKVETLALLLSTVGVVTWVIVGLSIFNASSFNKDDPRSVTPRAGFAPIPVISDESLLSSGIKTTPTSWLG